jgi:hypothetical protein
VDDELLRQAGKRLARLTAETEALRQITMLHFQERQTVALEALSHLQGSPPAASAPDEILTDVQRKIRDLYRDTGERPTEQKVADNLGLDRSTVQRAHKGIPWREYVSRVIVKPNEAEMKLN